MHVHAGRGGDGCVAFRREKFVPRGGPSGGDGGKGGSVVLVGSEGLNTLYHLRFRSVYSAQRGSHGEGSNRTGRSAQDLRVQIPIGTQVFDIDTDQMLGEILESHEELVVARGGLGGRGNARFASPTQQAPRHSEPGRSGEERRVRLELKLIADVGLVGLPNAGKSTLVSVISAARPKVASYPFTTLQPQLGVVAENSNVDPFVVADLPGLIEGAADGSGLGHRFLKHVERCRILLHLVDLSTSDGNADDDLAAIEKELVAFDPELGDRHRLVVGTKLDAAILERQTTLEQAARKRNLPYFEISSVSGAGLPDLLHSVRKTLLMGGNQ